MELRGIVEALLFASSEPLTLTRLEELASGSGAEKGALSQAIDQLRQEYDHQGRSFQIVEVARGYQLKTRLEYSVWVRKLFQPRQYFRLSGPTLETLAIVAYKQPITRPEIEVIRGVSVDGILKNLLERELIKIAGQKEVAGRPYLYCTSRRFLEHFGLNDLKDLPNLEPGEKPSGGKFDSLPQSAPSYSPVLVSGRGEQTV